MQCLFMEIKKNYYKEFIKFYEKIKVNDKELPKLLLHVCCGACSCYPLLFLKDYFEMTIYFTNSNIYPLDEYHKRLDALKKYLLFLELNHHLKITLIEDSYDYESFKEDLIPFSMQKEGLKRCEICIEKRLKRTLEYAKTHNFKYFSTVMSISRNKNVQFLNELGQKLASFESNLVFVPLDLKKNNGQDEGVKISRENEIYRQDYCGCEFSQNKSKKE